MNSPTMIPMNRIKEMGSGMNPNAWQEGKTGEAGKTNN